jgi:sec-independent protein translocase protein TatC
MKYKSLLPGAQEDKDMPFIDHLEELRWHIIRSVIAIVVIGIVVFAAKNFVVRTILLGPAYPDFFTYKVLCYIGNRFQIADLCVEKLNFIIQSRTMAGQFTAHITISFVLGLVVAFPYVFWEMWRFIAPGLHEKERKATQGAVFFVSFLFLTGVLFGYYVLAPFSINFLAGYQLDASIQNQFDLSSYLSTLVIMVVGCGLVFQLPMVVYALSRIGILTPNLMRTFRKHAVVVILIVSAILTPSPDIFTQMVVAVPLYFLYEISIFISAQVEKGQSKQ